MGEIFAIKRICHLSQTTPIHVVNNDKNDIKKVRNLSAKLLGFIICLLIDKVLEQEIIGLTVNYLSLCTFL